MVFMAPQRLVVPLFQRPYVWNEDNQWEPLWADVTRVAGRLLADPGGRHQPHFLGAVVLQQLTNKLGSLQERTIIDGQQRLTTLQLLLDALHAELEVAGAEQPARRLEPLVMNQEAFWEQPEDRFKVWPTNRDRGAFNEVMAADPPLNYDKLVHKASRLTQAHEYFAERAREWLHAGEGELAIRAAAIELAVREQIQMVVIDLSVDENAQEIFETLNARGAQLTAADLIKNFIFQRLSESGADVEAAYEQYWKEFESGFWETEISAGRLRYQRSSMFLNQWLIAKTGEEILARQVFYRFKAYADDESGVSMIELLEKIYRAGQVYRSFVDAAGQLTGPIDQVGLFAYRTGVMQSEVIKPLVLLLLDPDDEPIPPAQVAKALSVTESWLVRRMLVRATTKSYTQVIAELISHIRGAERELAGDVIEEHLAHQPGTNWYWPDDDEVRKELRNLPAYRRLSRARLRMVLEAIEDNQRGWNGAKSAKSEERVARGVLEIEHILPRRWQAHWPLPPGKVAAERDAVVDTIGNLTLLTGRLNASVSNGPWSGSGGKRAALDSHSVLMLNRHLLEMAPDAWGDDLIALRADGLMDAVLSIWPVPAGHHSTEARVERRPSRRIDLADLIAAGVLAEGATLHARRAGVADRTATVLSDGVIDVDGVRHLTPSGAARAVSGTSVNGWWFWLVDPGSRRSLRDVLREYVDQLDVDADDEEVELGADDDDDE
jgi:hypothetical protein